MSPSSDLIKLKVCMVGDAAVGKTSLVRRFVLDQFSDTYVSTLGAKVVAKEMVVDDSSGRERTVKMLVWDIMGEISTITELGTTYFHGVQGIVAVCDITRYSTFQNLPVWLDAVEKVVGKVPRVLAVNKTDLMDEALVLYDENEVGRFAKESGTKWFMTSARTGQNVESIFTSLVEAIVTRISGTKVDVTSIAPS